MEGLEEKADLVLPWVFLTALSKQRGFFLNPSHHCFSSVRQNDTKSCACPDSICNHMSNQWRVALKPCGEQSGPFPSSISHSHVEKKSFPQRSWAHFEHIIVLLFPYSLITVQSDYRVENKGRGWKYHPPWLRWMQFSLCICQLQAWPSPPCLVWLWL